MFINMYMNIYINMFINMYIIMYINMYISRQSAIVYAALSPWFIIPRASAALLNRAPIDLQRRFIHFFVSRICAPSPHPLRFFGALAPCSGGYECGRHQPRSRAQWDLYISLFFLFLAFRISLRGCSWAALVSLIGAGLPVSVLSILR